MYLVRVMIETPDRPLSAEELLEALNASAVGSDHLQHAYLETGSHMTILLLYLLTADEPSALGLAERLCRQTMEKVHDCTGWSVKSVRVGFGA